MKRTLFYIMAAIISIGAVQCGSNTQNANIAPSRDTNAQKVVGDTVIVFLGKNSKGIGRFRNIQLTHPLDEGMVTKGKAIFQSRCFACHKLTTEKLVGPGWSGVTNRRSPELILLCGYNFNFVTNTKVMVDRDLAAQADLAVCLIRMPDQELTDDQARNVLEFMRENDGKK